MKTKDNDKTGDQPLTHRPFKKLSLPVEPRKEDTQPPKKKVVSIEQRDREELDEEALYAEAMAGVTPMSGHRQLARLHARPRPMLAQADEEKLVMQHLDELVHGETLFDFSDTDEYIEACQSGFDRRLLRKLRRGEYSYQDHLDLHGLNKEEARDRVAAFIRRCTLEDKRCVLIVHGRGHGSKDNVPVLKNKLAAWLTRGAIGRKVLAFTSAKPYDGGTGAVYVLLRAR